MKRVLFMGDTHLGSPYAIIPEDVKTETGERIHPNKMQKFINARYYEGLDDIGPVDCTILMGDLIEGIGRHDDGSTTWTTNIMLQAQCAAEMISQVKCTNFFGVNGTPYHTGSNPSGDAVVLKMLDGKFGDYQVLNIGGKRIHACHKIGFSGDKGRRANALGTEIVRNLVNSEEWGKFDVLARGHAHYYACLEIGDQMGISIPCWKGMDPYAQQRGIGMVPELGFVLLEIHGGEVNKLVRKFTLKGQDLYKEYRL
jgi:hypothetical protein